MARKSSDKPDWRKGDVIVAVGIEPPWPAVAMVDSDDCVTQELERLEALRAKLTEDAG